MKLHLFLKKTALYIINGSNNDNDGRNKEQESTLSIYFIRDRTPGKGHWTFSKQFVFPNHR